MEIGKKLKQARLGAKLTQEQAAFLPESVFMVACVFCLAVVSVAFLLYQIVKKI